MQSGSAQLENEFALEAKGLEKEAAKILSEILYGRVSAVPHPKAVRFVELMQAATILRMAQGQKK
jgi:hypothetical protein